MYLKGSGDKKGQDYEYDVEESSLPPPDVSNPTGGQDSSQKVKDQLKTIANLVQAKMKSDGGFDQEELKKIFAQSGLGILPNVDKFNELDTNKNGKIEESEVNSDSKGEEHDYNWTNYNQGHWSNW